jgi:perosamine synthetase
MIPISKPTFGAPEQDAVLEVMRSGMVAMGRKTAEFEEAWAAYCGVRHAVLMSSGTVALEALLYALDVGPGDEVITVSFTFNATVSAILRVGAIPVFVDVNESDFGMDASQVELAISGRTRAILPVHMYGLMVDMAPLQAIAARHGIPIVEDAAQAHGASYRGARAGHHPGHAMFSLYATKNLTSGEGGFATTSHDGVADRLRLFRNHGMRQRYNHESVGTNFKPTDIAAAIGLAQLASLDERNDRRRQNADYLTKNLSADYLTPAVPIDRTHAWHQYTMRFPADGGSPVDGRQRTAFGRDHVARRLGERGVGTMIYYPIPVHRQAYMADVPVWHIRSSSNLSVTDRLAGEVLSIPVHPVLSREDLDEIITAVRWSATPRRPE